MPGRVFTFLMFDGQASAALELYRDVFAELEVIGVESYGPEERAAEGKIRRAEWTLAGQHFIAIDSPVEQALEFSPALSIFVDCDSEAEIEKVFGRLSEAGQVFLPLDTYPFSRKFGWLADRFGVSWQLNLP